MFDSVMHVIEIKLSKAISSLFCVQNCRKYSTEKSLCVFLYMRSISKDLYILKIFQKIFENRFRGLNII